MRSTQSILYTVAGIALARNDAGELALALSGRLSLTRRILAVNIIALALLAGGFFYLDSYRTRLQDARREHDARQVELMARVIGLNSPEEQKELIVPLAEEAGGRLRLYGPDNRPILDSWVLGKPNYELRDPAGEIWQRRAARFLDRMVDTIVWAPKVEPYSEPAPDQAQYWPEVTTALSTGQSATQLRYAPDRTPMVSAAAPVHGMQGSALLFTENARDITRVVRAERLRLAAILLAVVLISILLSLFLARTIVLPLRKLALAAHKVRLGRAREVIVPRLPDRSDEIGMLARAVADMSHALTMRIDAIEAFAADVSHELKNPLASLRSAIEGLQTVKDPVLQDKLLTIAADDVMRLDRLITDVSDASRLDAQISRTTFESIDLGPLIQNLVKARCDRDPGLAGRIAFARPRVNTAVVAGDGSRLTRVVENLLDNALSFSPPDKLVRIDAARIDNKVRLVVEDEGPGVPIEARDAIFARFHSNRPDENDFGRHSGLGLSIARTIIEGHNGSIVVRDRADGKPGARFEIWLPAKEI